MSKHVKRISIVDIGSNTIRLCVYDVSKDRRSFKKIADSRDSVGLASYLDETGTMSKQGIRKAAKAAQRMTRMAEMANSDKTALLATAAVRNCRNTKEVVQAIAEKTGHKVTVLSGDEEARLSMLGAARSVKVDEGLFFDLGGGSTELSVLSKNGVTETDSIPVGSLTGWKDSDSPWCTAAECAAIEEGFAELLSASSVHLTNHPILVGSGGSVRLALKVRDALHLPGDDRLLTRSNLDSLLYLGTNEPDILYRAVLETKPERTHTFLRACAIMRALLKATGCDAIAVSRHGLREGYVLEELRKKAR